MCNKNKKWRGRQQNIGIDLFSLLCRYIGIDREGINLSRFMVEKR